MTRDGANLVPNVHHREKNRLNFNKISLFPNELVFLWQTSQWLPRLFCEAPWVNHKALNIVSDCDFFHSLLRNTSLSYIAIRKLNF